MQGVVAFISLAIIGIVARFAYANPINDHGQQRSTVDKYCQACHDGFFDGFKDKFYLVEFQTKMAPGDDALLGKRYADGYSEGYKQSNYSEGRKNGCKDACKDSPNSKKDA